jgi:Kef-type K+ transport system membrane component KefB
MQKMEAKTKTPGLPRVILTYAGVVGLPLAALLAVISLGKSLSGPAIQRLSLVASSGKAAVPPAAAPSLALLVAQIGLVVLLSLAVGRLIQKIGQPRVIGEVLAGILLGPSLLGWVAPQVSAFLFPAASLGMLNAISQLGLVLFMFMVGLELNVGELKGQGHVAVVVSHASITAPMALGAALALYLYPRLSTPGTSFAGFALFMGVAMSITAFPVLAKILSERKMLRSRLGTMAISCAAVDDATGWCVLAGVVAFVRSSHSSLPLWVTLTGLPVYLVMMFWAGRKLLRKFEPAWLSDNELSNDYKAFLLVFLLISALSTEMLGLHLLFGAFVAGAIMPRHPGLVAYLIQKFESLTILLLLPLFFAYTGLRTNIGQINGLGMWGICLLIIAVAVAGKLGGTGIAARLSGVGWKESFALGSLMNTRGLMELVVLNIGLDIKIISPQLFSMMVIMAIATTMMAPPVLAWLYPVAAGELAAQQPVEHNG